MKKVRIFGHSLAATSILAGLLLLLIPVAPVATSIITATPAKASGTGGPIVLDGMDPVCHASGGENTDGYIAKVLKSTYDGSNGPNDGTIAILGTANPTSAGGCGGNWDTLLTTKFSAEFSTQPTYVFYSTPAEITSFFDTTISATPPKMIWIPDDWSRSSSVETVFTTNAEKIADFVNSGGGLFSSYGSYGWLTALLPNAVFNNGGCNGGPEATTDGTADFGLTDTIVAACWHGYFTGDVGTLKVLVDYPYPSPADTRKAVSIGGGSVSLPSSFMLAVSPTNPEAGQPLTITATAQTLAGAPQNGVTVSMTVSSGPDAGQTFTATTDASGIATFTINTSSVGSNTYTATATVNGVLKTVSVTTTWSPPSSTAPPTTSAPEPEPAPAPAPVPLYRVSLYMGDGFCMINGVSETATVSAVFIGYRYIPGPEECERDGFSMSGWANSSDPTTSANLPLLVDPSDGVRRYFIANDSDLTAMWSAHPIPEEPETTVPETPVADAPTTTVHDHSSHDHGLPATGTNVRLNLAVGFILAGAVVLFITPRRRELR